MGFSLIPRFHGLVFFQQLIHGGIYSLSISGGTSPTDKLRKNNVFMPVTSEKSPLFIGLAKIVKFCKALIYRVSGHRYPVSSNKLWKGNG
jgi:hypothetical protein